VGSRCSRRAPDLFSFRALLFHALFMQIHGLDDLAVRVLIL